MAIKERKKERKNCQCVAPPPSYYLRMSQNAADHVVHVQHADSELIYWKCLYILLFNCSNYPCVFTCIVYLCVLDLAFDHYSIINKASVITFDIKMEWITLNVVQIGKVCDSLVVIKPCLQFILYTCFTFSVSRLRQCLYVI